MEFRIRNPQTLRYRISVYDSERKVWVVKKSGLKKQDAEEVVADLFSIGINARMYANGKRKN